MTGSLPLYVFGAPVAAFAVTWMAITVLLRTFSDRILDHPNERSLHQRPVPRTGGLGVAAGIAVSVSLISPVLWWPLWIGAVLLVAISFLDDLIDLPIVTRLVMHIVAGSGLVCGLLFSQIGLGWALFNECLSLNDAKFLNSVISNKFYDNDITSLEIKMNLYTTM